MLVVPLAALVPPGRPPRTTKLDAADRARMRACRDELIARNLRLVLSVAGRYKPQPGLEFDDLVAEGNFGLAKAAARFDPGRGFRFSTYAVWWIRQAISHAVGHDARAIRLPAHVHDKLRRMRRLREEYREAHGRDPDDRHVAAALGIDHTKVRALGRAAREVASLDASALLRGGPRKGSGAAERFAPRAADLLADETQAPERHADAALARDARAHPADRARRALQAAHAAPRAQAGATRRPACGAVAVGDRLVAADDAGRACVVRQIKKG